MSKSEHIRLEHQVARLTKDELKDRVILLLQRLRLREQDIRMLEASLAQTKRITNMQTNRLSDVLDELNSLRLQRQRVRDYVLDITGEDREIDPVGDLIEAHRLLEGDLDRAQKEAADLWKEMGLTK